jgi:peroxiredoxin
MGTKLDAGKATPKLAVALVGGGNAEIGGARDGYQLAIVYRGKHCPICQGYLNQLNEMQDAFRDANTELLVISADPPEKAQANAEEHGWTFPLACDLSQEQMRALGLYISEPRSDAETDRPFAEPAAFLTNPEGELQVVDISNAPWVRADLNALLRATQRIQETGYPIRGTM